MGGAIVYLSVVAVQPQTCSDVFISQDVGALTTEIRFAANCRGEAQR